MKKIFLTALTLGFLTTTIVSCQSEKKDGASDSTSAAAGDSAHATAATAGTPAEAKATATEMAKAQVSAPDFSVSEVNDGIKEFSPIKDEYVAAIAKNDATAIKAAQDKFNTWVGKAATWGAKLPAKENQKYIEYYEKLVRQWEIVGKSLKK
ncbi:hypothetical protein [Pedobacter sp. UC225_65]|uniref:hypothetical protein n=1 Tax=Pedobacter sp. UC225_65 TaxID=3350173 RepID=UPI0036725D17